MLMLLIENDVTTGTVKALAATSLFRNVRRLASMCSNPSPSWSMTFPLASPWLAGSVTQDLTAVLV